MRRRHVVVGVALASILAGIAAFVIGLRQPIDATNVGMARSTELAR